jgi:hypothetical protein
MSERVPGARARACNDPASALAARALAAARRALAAAPQQACFAPRGPAGASACARGTSAVWGRVLHAPEVRTTKGPKVHSGDIVLLRQISLAAASLPASARASLRRARAPALRLRAPGAPAAQRGAMSEAAACALPRPLAEALLAALAPQLRDAAAGNDADAPGAGGAGGAWADAKPQSSGDAADGAVPHAPRPPAQLFLSYRIPETGARGDSSIFELRRELQACGYRRGAALLRPYCMRAYPRSGRSLCPCPLPAASWSQTARPATAGPPSAARC